MTLEDCVVASTEELMKGQTLVYLSLDTHLALFGPRGIPYSSLASTSALRVHISVICCPLRSICYEGRGSNIRPAIRTTVSVHRCNIKAFGEWDPCKYLHILQNPENNLDKKDIAHTRQGAELINSSHKFLPASSPSHVIGASGPSLASRP